MDFNTDDIVIHLKKLIKRIEQIQADLTDSDINITPAQARVIYPIVRDGKGYTLQELAWKVGVDKAFVSRTITDLEAKGIVVRDHKEGCNGRYKNKIFLSDKEEKKVAQFIEKHNGQCANWWRQFTDEELAVLLKVLQKFD